MRLAPLHLTDYFITELLFTANSKFDPKQEVPIQPDDFQIGIETLPTKDDPRHWQVVLKLQHQPPAEANVPCRLTVEIVGYFVVMEGIKEDCIERLVQTNGPSMLYGILREVVRDTSARGPYPPVMLPSTSFYKAEAPAVPAPAGDQPPAPTAVAETTEAQPPAKPKAAARTRAPRRPSAKPE